MTSISKVEQPKSKLKTLTGTSQCWLLLRLSVSFKPTPLTPSIPLCSSTLLANPGQEAKQRQEDARVGWLGPGSRDEGLQQCLTTPFADYIVNSSSSPWGKGDKKGFAQTILTPQMCSVNFQPAQCTQCSHGLLELFYRHKPKIICRVDLLIAPQLEMWLIVMRKNNALFSSHFSSHYLHKTTAEVFHCALKCSTEE